jgi:hypothetical protein
MKTLHWLIASAFGLGLVACDDGNDTEIPSCDGVEVAAGGSTYCASLITETGFLCPASLPEEFDFDGFTVCLPEGETPSDELIYALCLELASAGYHLDAATGECLNPDDEPVVPVPAGTAQPDAGVSDAGAPDVETDAGAIDTGGPDGIAPTDAGPTDGGSLDGDESDVDDDAAPDVDGDVGSDVDGGGLGDTCLSSEEFSCTVGLYCAQQEPVECTPSYVGVCTSVPARSEWDTPFAVCGCNEETYALGEGQAREAGYGGPIVACEFSGVCPDYALACPSECFEMSAARYNSSLDCLNGGGISGVVGCTSIEGGSDDAPCVKRLADGALFVATSGTAFDASMQWVACSDEEQATVSSASPCPER